MQLYVYSEVVLCVMVKLLVLIYVYLFKNEIDDMWCMLYIFVHMHKHTRKLFLIESLN